MLKLDLIDSNLSSRKPEPSVVAEASNGRENLRPHRFDATALEEEIAKRLSTLLAEKPDEADLASALLEV